MEPFRKEVNQITDYYMKEKNPKAYKELVRLLDDEEQKRLRIYGGGEEKQGYPKEEESNLQIAGNGEKITNHYKENKLQELYERSGNKILRELKNMTKEDRKELFQLAQGPGNQQKYDGNWKPVAPFKKSLFNEKVILHQMKKLEKVVVNERNKMRDEQEYEQLQQQIYQSQATQRGR
ncbi:hypothetical protein MAQA_15891 [Listeria aquatica FSL S10-1188]|uniref:Uncharacterized protein n=2 Tax=Listeria aquatica TaxID=1494960 RepID=W7ATN4_9LIST|nr:hypothetical protein MAQA_15891 [Listeria aquatica FSL S10-1188]